MDTSTQIENLQEQLKLETDHLATITATQNMVVAQRTEMDDNYANNVTNTESSIASINAKITNLQNTSSSSS